MDNNGIKSRIEKILDLPETDLATPINKVLADSLEVLDALVQIEDSLELNIGVNFKLQTFGDFVDLVQQSYSNRE